MTDYVVPSGVRIADADRVRLGAHLAEGTTVMHEGFVNFNAGTLGTSMVEGRISAGIVVGDGSDIGGGASIQGTLSGGGKTVLSIGERCLLGANAGIGISLGDDCVVEAGLYLTAGTLVKLPDGDVVKARELSGASNLLYRRHSQTGAVEAVPRTGYVGRPERRPTCQPVARRPARTRPASGPAPGAGSPRRPRRSSRPGVRIRPCSSRRSCSPGAAPSSHRKNVASPPAWRMPRAASAGHHDVALGAVDLAHVGDVLLVAPGDRGRALDELGRGDADVRPVALERGDQFRVAGHEARSGSRASTSAWTAC